MTILVGRQYRKGIWPVHKTLAPIAPTPKSSF